MTELPKRELGRTGLQVTRLGYGAMELRGAGHWRGREVTPKQAETILNAVLDAGINFIDTSIDYGHSEELIGQYISKRRSEYYLATKCGCLIGDARPPAGAPFGHVHTRENIVAGVTQSLARMKTDYIDLLQFHGNPSKQVLEENSAIETLLELKKEGKIRFIGTSSVLPNLAEHIAMGVFDAFQIPYSPLELEHEAAISRAAAGAGTIIRGGAARGAPAEGNQEGRSWQRWQQARLDELLNGMSPMEFLLRFTFTQPDLHTNIVGTLSPEHLQDNIDALLKGPLPPELYAEAKRRLIAAGTAPVPM